MKKANDMTGRPTLLKEINIGLIKEALGRNGEATRVELAEMTKISQPTVNQLIRLLLEEGTVVSLGVRESTGGRKAERYALNQKRSAALLVTAHRDFFEVVVADMNLSWEVCQKYKREEGFSYLEQLERIVGEMQECYPGIGALSVGVPGAVTKQGEVFAVPQIPEWENFALKSELEQKLSLPVSVSNDINTITVGYLAMQENAQNLVYIHMDETGMGAGIIIDGKLYSGRNSFAGELGYMQLGESSVEEMLADPEKKHAEILEQLLINVICVLNPEQILLSGEIKEELVEKMKENCSRKLPGYVAAQLLLLKNREELYFRGLGKMGMELLERDVQIVLT